MYHFLLFKLLDPAICIFSILKKYISLIILYMYMIRIWIERNLMSYNTALSFVDLDYSDIQVDISKFLFAYLSFPQSRFSLEKRPCQIRNPEHLQIHRNRGRGPRGFENEVTSNLKVFPGCRRSCQLVQARRSSFYVASLRFRAPLFSTL